MLELFPASSVSKLRAKRWKYWGQNSKPISINFHHCNAKLLPLNLQNVWALAHRLNNWGSQSISFEILHFYSAILKNTQNKWPSFSISCFEHLQFLCSFSFLSNHFISDLICWLGPQHHTPFQFNGQPCIEVMLGNVSNKTAKENLWPHLDLVSTKKVSQSPFFLCLSHNILAWHWRGA